MATAKKVSLVVIRRLPRYYRYLGELLNKDVVRISSKELSERMGVTASQIRQDLNCFGGFGQQGYGYNIEYLYREIGKILGVDSGRTTIIIGAGNLGKAIANYASFEKRGFKLIAAFDNNPEVVGKDISGAKVYHTDDLEQYIKTNSPDIAILCTPKEKAQEMADKLSEYGIRGIWNFSYMELKAPKDTAVETVHLSDSLMTLSCKISQIKNIY